MNYDDDPPFAVGRYREMQKAFPGADALYRLARAQIETALPQGGSVLIVGAGGGREIEALAASRCGFALTGVDPSADMIALARLHADAAGTGAAALIQGRAADVAPPPGGFDAATGFLVMHFLTDDDGPDGKAAHLRAIRARLRPGARYLHADIAFDGPDEQAATTPVFLRHAALAGLSDEDAAIGPKAIADMPIVSLTRTEALFAAAGFGRPRLFFQALWYRAWTAEAV